MAGFSGNTDYFGFGSSDLVVIGSSTKPKGQSIEYAQDEDGNNVAEDQYDADGADSVETTYELQANTLNLNTFALGGLLNGLTDMCVESINVTTSNGQWPQIVVSGKTGVFTRSTMPTFTLPSITISGLKQAQLLDFTIGADCRLTASNYTASGDYAFTRDDAGDASTDAFSGATQEIGGTATEIAGVVVWTPGSGWIEKDFPGAENGNINWGATSFAAEKFLPKDP